MGKNAGLGEFEQLVLLAILQLKDDANAPSIAQCLEESAQREVSRGALYSALDRLEKKEFLTWAVKATAAGDRGHPKRRFEVTEEGKGVLRNYRAALLELWDGLEEVWVAR